MMVRRGSHISRLRGLGDTCSDGPGTPWTWQRIKFTALGCNSPYNNYPMPSPGPGTGSPTIALSTDPAAASQPGAVFAGQDASGNAVYATPSTPQQNMTDFKASVDQYMNEMGNRNPPPAGDDCSHWYSFFDSSCQKNALLMVGLGVAGVLVLGVLVGGRGR